MPKQADIRIRRGTSSGWSNSNPILARGEMAIETDTRKIKIGDGSAAWNSLQYVRIDGGDLDLGTPYREATPPGLDVRLEAFAQTGSSAGVGLTFSNVSGSGTTTVAKIAADAGSPDLPGNFSLNNSLGSYNITTTATFVGNVIIEFVLPSNVTQQVFDSVRIFKLTSGVTTDVTVLNGQYAPNFATRTVYASVTSFSEFYIIPSVAPSPTTTTVAPTTTTTAPILADRYIGSSWLNYTAQVDVRNIYVGNSWVNYAIPKNLSTIYVGNSWINYNVAKVLPNNNANIGTSWINHAVSN